MHHPRQLILGLLCVAVVAAGCEVESEDAAAPPDLPRVEPVMLPGIERRVDPPASAAPEPVGGDPVRLVEEQLPTGAPVPAPSAEPSPLDPAPTVEATIDTDIAPIGNRAPGVELALVHASTSQTSSTAPLDGATPAGPMDVRLEVSGGVPVRVEWSIDGTMFRDDDLNAPFNIRYAGQLLPVHELFGSDQGLAGQWELAPGSTHTISAVALVDGARHRAEARFTVGGAPAAPPSGPQPTVPQPTTAPTTTAPPATSTTTTAAPSTGSWSDHVEAPRGVLGPVTSTAVDPESVGIRWDGDRYVVPGGFTWDESSDGGYLLFTKGRVVINGDGVVLSGVVFDDIYSGGNPVIKAGTHVGPFTLRHFRSVGGRGSAVVDSSPGRGDNSVVSNFEIVGFDGDGIKPMVGSTFTDGFIHLSSDPSSGKHYDGVQITGRSNVTLSRLRFRLEGENNINAAIFVHSFDGTTSNNTTITDIDVEHIPYSWYPIRLGGGSVVMHDVVGRGPLSADARRPGAFVQHAGQSGIDWGSIWVAFDGPVDLETR